MEKSTHLPPPPLLPRSLASFISITNAELRPNRERRFVSWILAISGLSLLIAIFPTPYRVPFMTLGLVPPALITAFSYLRLVTGEAQAEDAGIDHLFRFLNYRRAKEGLETVIGGDMLRLLEIEAQVWEQIESALQGEHWHVHPDLADRIRTSAEHAMVELIALGTSSSSKEQYPSWYVGWDLNAQRLRDLLTSVKHAERYLLAYHRETEMSAGVMAPEEAGFPSFEHLLRD